MTYEMIFFSQIGTAEYHFVPRAFPAGWVTLLPLLMGKIVQISAQFKVAHQFYSLYFVQYK